MAKRIEDEIKAIRAEILHTFTNGLDEISEALESPIERAFYWAFIAQLRSVVPYGWMPPHSSLPGCADTEAALLVESRDRWIDLDFWAQVPVVAAGNHYRLDFAIDARHGSERVLVDIECDGHDYHERTKEQAEHDKRRDRDLQSIGYRIARFTGSEIFRSPESVAIQAYSFASGLLREMCSKSEGESR